MISLLYDKTIGLVRYGAGSVLNLAPDVESNMVKAGDAIVTPFVRAILQTGIRCHSDAVGTWSQVGNAIIISRTAHGVLAGDKYAFTPSAGTGVLAKAGIYTVVATPDANTLAIIGDANTTGTGTMNGTEVQTLFAGVIPGGSLGKNGSLRIMCRHRHTNSTKTKTFEIFFGGVKFTQYPVTTSLTSGIMAWIQNLNSPQLQQWPTSPGSGVVVGAGSYNATGGDWARANIDTSVDQQLVVKCTKTGGAESASLDNIIVELIPSLD